MSKAWIVVGIVGLFALGGGCKKDSSDGKAAPASEPTVLAEGQDDHDHEHTGEDHEADHEHGHGEEIDIGSMQAGDLSIALAQGHGKVEPGKEMHLVVKLPYKDEGATVVRAWIGTSDRTASFVGKGEYAASHDDYDVHAIAPDPLPEKAMWWVEIEKPDGTKVVGSAKPILE